MNFTFLTVARQGRNGWKRYLTAIALIIGTFSIVCLPLILMTTLIAGLPLENSSYDAIFYDNFYGSFALIVLGTGSFLLGLFLAVTKIHQRNFLTLVSPNNSISWQRIIQGFSIFLALRIVAWILLYFLLPDRYILSFQASTLFNFLLSFLVLPITATATALWLAYLLQGLGLVIRNSLALSILWGLLLGGIPYISNWNALVLLNIFHYIFIAWIIFKDNRLELVMGLMIADRYFTLLLKSGENAFNSPSIFQLADSASTLPSILYFLFVYGIFYYIFFGRKNNTLSPASPH
ncbi:MAG: hypothetical protein F6K32_10135 [Desertifilum sp. SIO1I2]|nr:hypothetical protein [Desertifilum sp. SIO1I2]